MNDVKWGWKKATAIFSAIVISGACLGAATTAMAGAQGGESVEDLRAMIDQLKNTVLALEQKIAVVEDNQVAANKTIQEVAAKESTSNLLLPENTTMKIYGYAKLDAVYTDTGGTYEYAYVPSAVPLDSANVPSNSFVMHAKQTRLGFATSTDTDYGKFNTKIECDFYGGASANEWVSNSWGLRLRRAYGELGNLRVGQDWSTFIDLGAYPETLDFGGAAGSLFIRQAMVRWTQPFEGGSFQFAVENPEAKSPTAALWDDYGNPIYGSDVTVSGNNEYMPDFIARVNFNPGGIGRYSVVGLARQFSYDNGVTDDTDWGAAVSANAIFITFGEDNLHLNINYGNGLGRYMESEFQDAFINPITGDIETNNQIGGFVSYQHFWLHNLRSTAVYSYAQRDNDNDFVSDAVDKSYQSVHANIIWSPIPRVNMGLEYIYGYRKIENGDNGDMNRLMCSFQYNF